MPMFTYMNDSELESHMKSIEDLEVLNLMEDIRKLYPKFYIVPLTHTTTKGFIRKRKETRVDYYIFIRTVATEVQEINIGKDKISVMAYMYGFINGLNSIVLI